LALKQHKDDKVRYDQQVDNSESDIIPFLEKTIAIKPGVRVFDLGTGEGGVLIPFLKRGCYCVGVDLSQIRIDLANEFLADEVAAGKAKFICQNILENSFYKEYNHSFDVIILKDVIEHIPDQEKFIPYLAEFLAPGGQIFFGFPPWCMPFGGHQQACHVKWLSVLPYYHLLPGFLYKAVLKLGGEDDVVTAEMMEVKSTGISIHRFERIIKRNNLKVLNKAHYLINPIYRYKFGLKPKLQFKFIEVIPWFRDFFTTCVYYTIGK